MAQLDNAVGLMSYLKVPPKTRIMIATDNYLDPLDTPRITIQFDSHDDLVNWFNNTTKSHYEQGQKSGEVLALGRLQNRARELFKDVFGIDLK
jgi:hypothetical protein